MADDDRQVIRLRLQHLDDLFVLAPTDLFSEYRNYFTGLDFAISTLRSRRSRRPVRLEITLPPEQIEDGQAEKVKRSLHHYCSSRMKYNERERKAIRFDGVSALRVGLPLAIVGLVVMVWATQIEPVEGMARLVTDHIGFVLAWLGLWWPLDQFFFYGLGYGRENRVLALLRDADVVVQPEPALLHT